MQRRPPRSTLFPTRRSSDLLAMTIEDQGFRRMVRPEVVLEVAFDSIQHSGRHMSGYALRFPRMDRKSTRLNSSHSSISYAVFCLKKKTIKRAAHRIH